MRDHALQSHVEMWKMFSEVLSIHGFPGKKIHTEINKDVAYAEGKIIIIEK